MTVSLASKVFDVPRRELDAAERAVGHLGAHEPARRVVVHDRRDADFARGFRRVEAVLDALKYGLVLLDRLALVVEDGLAARDPAQRSVWRVLSGSGSACAFFTSTLPPPSEYSKATWSGLCSAARELRTCVSRWMAQRAGGTRCPGMIVAVGVHASPK